MNLLFIEYILFLFIFLLLYCSILYPILLRILSVLFKKPINEVECELPAITVCVAAYNEEDYIENCIISIYNTGYPVDKIFVQVGSDGSSDGTIEILKRLQKEFPTLKVYELERKGKNSVVNFLVKESETDVVFLMDADLLLQKGMIEKIIAVFSDESVGCVISSIRQIIEGEVDSGGYGETIYQKYDMLMKSYESKIWSTINNIGQYAIRRELFMPIPNDRIADDNYEILAVVLKKRRAVFCSEAQVLEVRKKSSDDEFSRRSRVSAASMAAVWSMKRLLLPDYGWSSFFLWSHKVLRWLMPFYLIIIAVLSVYLSFTNSIWLNFLIVQAIFYLSSGLAFIDEKYNKKVKNPLLKISLYFVSMNIGFLFAWKRFILSQQNSIWTHKF